MPPRILFVIGSCPSASNCASDHGTPTAVVIGLGVLILLAVVLVKLGGPDRS